PHAWDAATLLRPRRQALRPYRGHRPSEAVRGIQTALFRPACGRPESIHLGGKKADDSADEIPKDKCSTKIQIMGALKRSAAETSDALREKSSGMKEEVA